VSRSPRSTSRREGRRALARGALAGGEDTRMPADDLIAERRRKVEELAARGIPAYGVDFSPSATTEGARGLLVQFEDEHPTADSGAPVDGPVVAVPGRVMQLHDLGAMC